MKGPWEVLGLSPDSDRDAIRRAYAAKLRRTRPEENPQGFIALREAYEAALDWAEHGARFGDGDLDEELLDDEAGEDAWEDEDEPDLRTRIAPFRPGAAPWAAPSGAPAGATPEVDEGRRRLGKATETLGRALGSPWGADEERLGALFDAFLRALAEVDFGAREGAEFWLAEVLADNVPRSDPLLLPAAEAFGWHEDALERYPPAVHFLLRRLDEWRLINMLRAPGHELEEGWRALTSARAPWRRRLHAAVPGVAGQVGTLLDIADWQAPGLSEFMNRDAARWWTEFLRRPHLGAAALLGAIGCLCAAALAALLLASAPPATRWATVGVLALAGVAVPVLDLRLFSRLRERWRDDPPSVWVTDGWAASLLSMPVLAMLLPPTPWGVAGFSLLAAITALWLFLFAPHMPGVEQRPFALVLVLGALILLGAAPFLELSPERRAVLAAVGLLFAAALVRGFGTLHDIVSRLPVPPLATAVAITAAYLLLAGQLSGFVAQPSPFFVYAPAIGVGLLAFNVAEAPGGISLVAALFARGVLMVAYLVAAGGSVPSERTTAGPFGLPLGIVPGEDRMVLVEEAEPAFAVLRQRNPQLHSQVRDTLERMDAGQFSEQAATVEVNRLLSNAYHRALPTAPDALLVKELMLRVDLMSTLREANPRWCMPDDMAGDDARLPENAKLHMRAHIFDVLTAKPVTAAERAAAKPVETGELILRGAELAGSTPDAFARELSGKSADECIAKIRLLNGLLAYPPARVAATLRAQLEHSDRSDHTGASPTARVTKN